jgi:hypothetical protein
MRATRLQRPSSVHVFALVAVAAVAPVRDALAAQRTFVSTSGADANACTLVAPCRGFARAITQTDAGGEIVVLDSGGYGIVTIDKNVSIVSPAGVYAGISVFAAQDGVTVIAPATKVVLRGLTINGQGGDNGIRVQAGEVHVESIVISNMAAAGIRISGGSTVRVSGTVARSNGYGLWANPLAGTASVLVRDSEFGNNATAGVAVQPDGAGTSALVTVERSSATKNGVGFSASATGGAAATMVVTQSVASENVGAGVASGGATVFVRESASTRNAFGLFQAGVGAMNACGANLLVANGATTSGTINVNAGACLDQVAGGTVTSVGTGPGLAGGPITTSGTVNLAATNLLPTTPCGTNQVPQWNGAAWTCASAGTGTVTSVGTGTGLSGGPITASGTIAADTAYLQRRVTGTCAANSSIRTINADGTVVCEADDAGPANAFVQGGNAFGATAVLGTTDNNALDLRVNGARVVRYEPNAVSPNVVAGSPANNVTAGVRGATIGGGGVPPGDTDPLFDAEAPNRVTDSYGTVAGGYGNRAGDDAGGVEDRPFNTVGGGRQNTASGDSSFVGGGWSNTSSGVRSTVGGGGQNTAGSIVTTVGGGYQNTASNIGSTVAGGDANTASGVRSTVGGGGINTASGSGSTVAGGYHNAAGGSYSAVGGGLDNVASGDYSWAGGRLAETQTGGPTPVIHHGAFVWSDGNPMYFRSSDDNEFAARATGGVRFVTAIDGSGTPTRTVRISPNGELEFGSVVRQMLNFYGTTWGIGVQASTQYFRTGNHFGWYLNGVHSDSPLDPGAGGSMLMTLTNGASASTVTGTLRAQVITATSDAAQKTGFVAVDAQEILARIVEIPIATWAYRTEPAVRHIGPTGQDFRGAFGLGSDDKSIATVDADGVALAAIQGLNAKLETTVAAQAREIADLRVRLAGIEGATDAAGDVAELKAELALLRAAVAELRRAAAVVPVELATSR